MSAEPFQEGPQGDCLGNIPVSQRFPKSARLLRSREFKFPSFGRFCTPEFTFIFNHEGKGRLGVSISKKILRRAVARNRVRRLIREVFRERGMELSVVDLHLIGRTPLTGNWDTLKKGHISEAFERFREHRLRGAKR